MIDRRRPEARRVSRVGVEADVGGLFAIHMPLKARTAATAVAAEVRKVIDAVATGRVGLRGR